MPTRLHSNSVDSARKTLKNEKVFTLARLTSLLDCSRRTAQTRLSLWKTYTSYNYNSKFYTLPEIPKFDSHGLWWYKDIAFSKHGNLKKTIIHLVKSSGAGLSGKELGALVGLLPQNFVHHFRHSPGIIREKHNGVFIHFSSNSGEHEQQVRMRVAALLPIVKDTISEGNAILILVAIIKYHNISLEEILTIPEVNKSGVSEFAVRDFMEAHGLLKNTSAIRQ